MTDRLAAALAELVDALRAEIRADAAPVGDAPERLYSIDETAALMSCGRTLLYDEIGAGRLRSICVGRRRLVAASAIVDFIATKRTPAPLKADALEVSSAGSNTTAA